MNDTKANKAKRETLLQIYENHSEKISDKWEIYIQEYDKILINMRELPITILEIGVQNGGSLEIWGKYFHHARIIVGCDINEKCALLSFDDDRIKIVVGDANNQIIRSAIISHSANFDIIVEDGSHTVTDTIRLFCKYFSVVKPGGLYIVEDIHCSYWEQYGGGLHSDLSSIAFFKKLIDILNFEHWGINANRDDILKEFCKYYGIEINIPILEYIHSITFVNSLCVITRSSHKQENLIGKRIIRGQHGMVEPGIRDLISTSIVTPDESNNPHRGSYINHIEVVHGLESKNAELKRQILNLEFTNDLFSKQLKGQKNRLIRFEQLRMELEFEKKGRIYSEFELKNIIEQLKVTKNEIENRLWLLENSTIWKSTFPIRKVSDKIPTMARLYIRKSATIIWWTINGRVLKKLKDRSRNIPLLIAKVDNTNTSNSQTEYLPWIARFDTPSIQAMKIMRETSSKLHNILIVIFLDKNSIVHIQDILSSIKRNIGVSWHIMIRFSMYCNISDIDNIKLLLEDQIDICYNILYTDLSSFRIVTIIDGAISLRPHALRTFFDGINKKDKIKAIYSDEDTINSRGVPANPWFKPQFSRHLIEQGALLGRVVMFKNDNDIIKTLINEIIEENNSIYHILSKRVAAFCAESVAHIPHVLYHNIVSRNSYIALRAELDCNSIKPNVSIIIPTKNRWDLLQECLKSVYQSDWPRSNLEIIVVDNSSEDVDTIEGLIIAERKGLIRLIRDNLSFNFSRLINIGVKESSGDIVIMLNNDTVIIDKKWIYKLVGLAMRPGVGAVGAKLLYPDNTVQHGGVIGGIQGVACHAHVGISKEDGGYCNLANLTHEVLAVTGACIAISRQTYNEVGGLDEEFKVAFNDIVFCLELHERGFQNIYLSDPILIHHESKTRGFDDTPEKIDLARKEARLAWIKHPTSMREDPYYSPCLSLEIPYSLAKSPRRRPMWLVDHENPFRIMMLSSTHALGHGVAVVIEQQVHALIRQGFQVLIAGPVTSRDILYEDCERIEVSDPRLALVAAVERNVDVIVTHTPPFFGVARWAGAYPLVVAYDYGEPPPAFFPDASLRREILADKDQALVMCSRVFAISDAIASESRTPVDSVIPLGNSHMGKWDQDAVLIREKTRKARGWTDKKVILNVCRFHHGERFYKGIDNYIEMMFFLKKEEPNLYEMCQFVLCGKGDESDIEAMEKSGLTVIPNVSDQEMFEIYAASDCYANFSRWEGYNLGIGQALAMGLPVIASDIPAHRNFDITVVRSPSEAVSELAVSLRSPSERTPKIWDWGESLDMFVKEISELCAAGRGDDFCVDQVAAAHVVSGDVPSDTEQTGGAPRSNSVGASACGSRQR